MAVEMAMFMIQIGDARVHVAEAVLIVYICILNLQIIRQSVG